MRKLSLRWIGLCVLSLATVAHAANKFQIDTGECQEETGANVAALKTSIRASKTGALAMYGILEFNRTKASAKDDHCHVIYRLFLSQNHQPFKEVHHLVWDTETGEIAGIDLLGFSPDNSKAAANFWLAEGDGQEDRPVVYDLSTNRATFRSMEQKLEEKTSQNCDDYVQNVDSVTNEGIVLVSVPAYEACLDKGLWAFDPTTGSLKRIRKISGRKKVE